LHNPRTDFDAFDLVIVMDHDGLAAPNVLSLPTALNEITPGRLIAASKDWTDVFAPLKRPLTGVLLGGPTKQRPFTLDQARTLLNGLQARRRVHGGSLAVTASRRTPPEISALFAAAAAVDPGVWFWNGEGPNPYLGVLAHADRLVVTSDSVSMISEALATPRPVEVFDLNAGRRHAAFLDGLIEQRLVRRFPPHPPPLAPP